VRGQIEAEVADQLEQFCPDRSLAQRETAAVGLLRAAASHELEPDDFQFWQAVADKLRHAEL